MKIKLLSGWFGPLKQTESWLAKYKERMSRLQRMIDWEMVAPTVVSEQLPWLDALVMKKLGVKHSKVGQFTGDLRPMYGVLFEEKYAGFDWWGWIDLDIVMSARSCDILEEVLAGDHEAISFKDCMLSGCFAMFRNNERMRNLFRHDPCWQRMAESPLHWVYDESGHPERGNRSMWHLLMEQGVKVSIRGDLMGYESPSEPHDVREEGDRLMYNGWPNLGEWREVLFHHFTTDVWPESIK